MIFIRYEKWETIEEIRNKLVATFEGTTSVAALEKIDAFVVTAKTIDLAYEKLLKDEIDALVFDSIVFSNFFYG